MEVDHQNSLEQALAKTEADADAACKAATIALRSLKKFRAAAQVGNLRELQKAIEVYCYPSLIRVLPNDRAVVIDKTRERRLRPSVLVRHLQELQNKPVRFRSEAFLESLHDAYSTAVKTRSKERRDTGPIVPLVEIYNLLTLLPGQAKEYSRQEFARDLYLLDQSGVTTARNGAVVSFHAARGNEAASKVIPIITKDGQAKTYYGISFTHEQ